RNPKISTYTEALMVGETSAQIWPRYVFWFSASALDEASTWMKERRCHSSLQYGISRGRMPICSRSFSWTADSTAACSKTRSSGGGTRGAATCSASPALTTTAPFLPGPFALAGLGASGPVRRARWPRSPFHVTAHCTTGGHLSPAPVTQVAGRSAGASAPGSRARAAARLSRGRRRVGIRRRGHGAAEAELLPGDRHEALRIALPRDVAEIVRRPPAALLAAGVGAQQLVEHPVEVSR